MKEFFFPPPSPLSLKVQFCLFSNINEAVLQISLSTIYKCNLFFFFFTNCLYNQLFIALFLPASMFVHYSPYSAYSGSKRLVETNRLAISGIILIDQYQLPNMFQIVTLTALCRHHLVHIMGSLVRILHHKSSIRQQRGPSGVDPQHVTMVIKQPSVATCTWGIALTNVSKKVKPGFCFLGLLVSVKLQSSTIQQYDPMTLVF